VAERILPLSLLIQVANVLGLYPGGQECTLLSVLPCDPVSRWVFSLPGMEPGWNRCACLEMDSFLSLWSSLSVELKISFSSPFVSISREGFPLLLYSYFILLP